MNGLHCAATNKVHSACVSGETGTVACAAPLLPLIVYKEKGKEHSDEELENWCLNHFLLESPSLLTSGEKVLVWCGTLLKPIQEAF